MSPEERSKYESLAGWQWNVFNSKKSAKREVKNHEHAFRGIEGIIFLSLYAKELINRKLEKSQNPVEETCTK